ncbi:DUF4249 domain-containing protein [uncultured Hymenobacter sp.]|uniref:DUF4249 domain-containing protein n=1 Tax=uncultured Hymenobacter sp. TaxID=170016 RepID=UPI0035C972F4
MAKISLLLLTAALSSCESTVDLPEPPHTPRVALTYTLTTTPQDSSFRELYQGRQLYLSNSQRVFDQSELRGRADATVELRDAAGAVVERYRHLPPGAAPGNGLPGAYRPVLNFQPRPGQTYTLRATLPGLETAESTLTLPQPAVIDTAAYVLRAAGPNDYPGSYRGRLTLTVRDDPATANYYLAYARVLDRQGQPAEWSALEPDYESQDQDVVLGQFQLSSPGGSYGYQLFPFADDGLNGQRLTLATDARFYLAYSVQGSVPPEPGYIEVTVSSITAEAYQFYLSRRRYYDSNDNPFAEPAPLASNVRAGYGLFGGATDVTYRIRLF